MTDAYIRHQKEVITRRTQYDLEKAKARLHIVEGLIAMVSILDAVIKTIRNSQNKRNAKENIMANKIFVGAIEGRVSKQLKDICLLDQTYVRAEDGKQTVAAYLKSVNSALVIKNVVRFEVGEGMEKKNEDFAAEVAKQMAGN